MKVRKVTIEVEVPWTAHHLAVLDAVSKGLTWVWPYLPHQEQVVKFEESSNTCIGEVTKG